MAPPSVTSTTKLRLAIAFALIGHGAIASAGPVPEGLLCEYLVEPLGIDIAAPRLSWRLSPPGDGSRGNGQAAYRLIVASTRAQLDAGVGDRWDSGWVESSRSLLVPYAGDRLQAGDACWWTVSVRDKRGGVGSAPTPGYWSMGPLEESDWSAEWIGASEEFAVPDQLVTQQDCTFDDPWLRTTIELPGDVERAELHVASVGYHELYVNGQKVSDDVLAPAVSNHRLRARYVTYDIGPLLRPGKNSVGVWLGASWSVFPLYQSDDKPAAPIVRLQGDIHLAGGRSVRVQTDGDWKTHPSSNRLLGAWNFMNFGGERQDAQRHLAGWASAGFDDAGWERATVNHPKLITSAAVLEPNRVVAELRGQSVEPTGDGGWRVDMGKNFAGLIEVPVRAEPGVTVEIRSSEEPDQKMTFRLFNQCVVGDDGAGVFRSRFNYQSGRWLTIRGASQPPKPDTVRGYLTRSDFPRTGRFVCSDDRINRVYETCLWTFENLALGGYVVDCPQRERMGYGGDAHATIRTALTNYGMGAFYTKWLQDFADVQIESGYVPNTAPTMWGGGGPAWGGICITLPWEVHRRYGDVRLLKQAFPMVRAWLAFLESKSTDDLLRQYGAQVPYCGDEWSFLGDWLRPGASGTNSHTRESLFLNNAYWVHNLRTAARLAETIGESRQAAAYRRRAGEIAQAIHAEFYERDRGAYQDGSQAALAIALTAGVPPSELRAAVASELERSILVRAGGHIDAGITGGALLFEHLLNEGRNDLIHPMVTRSDYPGWLEMLDRGATTFEESWDNDGSRLHSSYLYVGAWPIHGLAGIRPGPEAGFARFDIRPPAAAETDVEWVESSYDGGYGDIRCDWRRGEGRLELRVVVPPNTSADLYLPTSQPTRVRENDRPLGGADGVVVGELLHGRLHLELSSGEFRFTSLDGVD